MWRKNIIVLAFLLLAVPSVKAERQNPMFSFSQSANDQNIILNRRPPTFFLDDNADFLQFEQKTEDAVVKADLEYLKNIYAEDFRFAHGSGSIQNKSQWLASVAKGQFISRRISANEVELHDDIAITSARLDVTRRGKNGEEKYWIKYIRVYRRSGDGWKMISHRTTQEVRL